MAETKTQAAEPKKSGWMTKLFGFDPSTMKVSTEIVAGITTFLAMSYILAVNPSILADCGMDKNALFTTTAVASILATLVMAFYAKLPFALAPGMGLNAFFCYTVCLGMGYSWQFALTAVLIEGIIFIILTLTSVREAIVNALPLSLRKAIGAGIGLFIALIGLKGGGIVVDDPATLVNLGDITGGAGLPFRNRSCHYGRAGHLQRPGSPPYRNHRHRRHRHPYGTHAVPWIRRHPAVHEAYPLPVQRRHKPDLQP